MKTRPPFPVHPLPVLLLGLALGPFLGFPEALGQQPPNPLLKSWPRHLELRNNTTFGLEWVSLGPVRNSARAACVQGDPTRPGTLYAAFGPGNLWKTTDGGLTWEAVFENQPVLGIGDVALAPSRPETIWLGTGVDLKKPRNFTMTGAGVFRSDDGGRTWRHLGLEDSYHIGKVDVHPRDPETAFVAVHGHYWTTNPNRGVYRTRDGGKTWDHVLFVNERTGANDVLIAPSDPNVVYATTWENYPDIAGPSSGVYKSEDGGTTWRRLAGVLPSGNRTGRIGLAVSARDAAKAYVLVDNLNRGDAPPAEVYRTDDGGRTWRRTHKDDLLIFGRIGWYFADIYLNPQDDEEVCALGIRVARSGDGGKTFGLVGGDIHHLVPNPSESLHLDHCEMWIDPANPNHLALANDGGVYTTWNKGRTWLHHNNIPAGEFYDISVDDQSPYRVFGGTQDDASVFGPAREWDPPFSDEWTYVWLDAWSGGDGCVTFADPTDPNVVYFSSQNGAARRKDLRTGRSKSIQPRPAKDFKGTLRYSFITPYFASVHDSKVLYHAGNYVFKSGDRGDTWSLISPDLSTSSDPGRTSTAAGAVAESPLRPGSLYVGQDRGAFWVTGDDGKTWEERSAGLPPLYIRSICPSRFKPGRVYVAVSGMNYDDFGCHLYVSEDDGRTWTPLSAGLPEEVSYVILEDPTNENLLFAGLLRGVYVSPDRGATWSLLGPNLPAAAVSDLVIQEREGDLLAGTYGRGIYKMNIKPVREAFRNGPPKTEILFPPPTAVRPWVNDTHRNLLLRTAEKVPLTFYLTREAEVTLSVSNSKGEVVWSRPFRGRTGFNEYRWDLVTKTEDSAEANFFQYSQHLAAGSYALKLTGEGVALEAPFRVEERLRPPD